MLQQAQSLLMSPYYPEINMGGHPTFVDLMAPYPESSHQSLLFAIRQERPSNIC